MNLLDKIKNRRSGRAADQAEPTAGPPSPGYESPEPDGSPPEGRPPRRARLLQRISPRARLGKNARQSTDPPDPNDPLGHTLTGGSLDQLDAGKGHPTASTLEDLLASERGAAAGASTSALLTEESYLDEAGDDARRNEAAPVHFDTRATTIFEPLFRYTLIAALVCLVLVAVYLANMARVHFTDAGASPSQAGAVADSADASATSDSGRAATLAEDFASAYLEYPAQGGQNSGDYLATLAPFLHPDADADLFATAAGEQRANAEVSYVSARSVQPMAGQDRYKVLVDSRIGTPGSGGDGGEEQDGSALSRTLTVYVQAPPEGGDAYVIAPPRLTEPPSDDGAGTPGIYGYEGARTIENESGLQSTVENFFDALYAPVDSRPLVKEQLEPGAEVDSFPPESSTYEGIERSAIYYRDDLEQAEELGYIAIYDIEVYVRVSDETTGSTSLDSWAMTVGESEQEGYKIIDIS